MIYSVYKYRGVREMNYKILMIILVMFFSGCSSRVYSGEMDVLETRMISFDDCYSEYITVVVNTKELEDYERCAQDIIERYITNSFTSVDFCFDEIGYPNELNAVVFLTEENVEEWKPIFEMSYRTDSFDYNIKDDSERYTLKIKSNV